MTRRILRTTSSIRCGVSTPPDPHPLATRSSKLPHRAAWSFSSTTATNARRSASAPGLLFVCASRSAVLAFALLTTTPALAQAPFRITGTALNAIQGTPISGAHLTALPDHACPDAGQTGQADTSPAGQFTLTLPCAGTWRLTAAAPGFAPQLFEQHGPLSTGIVLTRAQPVFDLTFRLTPDSSISGIVLDDAGEPVRDAKVTLLSVEAGPDPPRPVDHAITNDLGVYEFANLLPGAYQVAVQAQPWYARGIREALRFSPDGNPATPVSSAPPDPSLDLTYPITWFPGVTSPGAATTLQVSGGIVQQADLRLTPIPSIHLLLPNPSSSDDAGATGGNRGRRPINLQPFVQISELGQSDFRPTSVTIAPDGSIDLGGFAPGTYAVPRFQYAEAPQQDFELGPDSPHSVAFASLKKTDDPSSSAPASSPDRRRPGARGRSRFQNPEDTPAEPSRDASGGLTLGGIVQLDGKPVSGAMLLLVPAGTAPSRRTPAPRQQSNTDGSFAFDRLAPGRYLLVAFEQGWSLDLRTAAALNPYLLRGTPVNLTSTTSLRSPVTAQASEKKPLP